MKYRLSYFPEQGGLRKRFVVEESELLCQEYFEHVSSGCKRSLCCVLIEQLDTFAMSNGSVIDYPPAIGSSAPCCLILSTQNQEEELNQARRIRDAVGVVAADIPSTIDLLAKLVDRCERENIELRSKIHALEAVLGEASL